MTALVEVRNLSKSFSKKDKTTVEILSDINFVVEKGECFVIIGPNGCGKTTLLRIIGLLESVTEGEIVYDGATITQISNEEKVDFRRRFSFVHQKPVVLDTTVYNNIAFGLKIRSYNQKEIDTIVKESISLAGLEGFEKENARNLSGGEMQRVVIAMNFAINPDLFILDEVMANLDAKNVSLLEDVISRIKQDKNKTIIMSTHDRTEAIKLADRIGVLIGGKFTQIGTPREIFTQPKDEFTAKFVGYENIFSGIATDNSSGLTNIEIDELTIVASEKKEGVVKVCIRPESIMISKNKPSNVSFRNIIPGVIKEIRELGNVNHVFVDCKSVDFLVSITKKSSITLDLKKDTEVYINFKATDIQCL